MLKKLLLCLAAVLLLTACDNTGGHYKIIVTFPDNTLDGQTAYLTSYDSGDTLAQANVADKAVVLEGELEKSYMARLLLGGKRLGLVVENGEISILWADKKATGTPLNESLNALYKEIEGIEADTTANVDSIVGQRLFKAYQDNRDNGIGPWAFNYYLMYNQFTEAQIDSLLKDAPAGYRNLTRVKKALKAAHQLQVTAVGQPFTDFSNSKGESLSDYAGKGKYTLVDFWASWCGPCRREIANIKPLYEQLKDKMNFVGVAVWDKPEDTQKAIEELQVPWPVIQDAQNWTTPTDLYGISGIPHIMLIGPDGKILARGLAGQELVDCLKSLPLK